MVKKLTQTYETPNEGWSEERIQREHELTEEYGLQNKREIYKAQSELRSLRRQARNIFATQDDTQRKELLQKVQKLGLIPSDGQLEDILTLDVEDILDRRLQTAVNRRGHSDTATQARQLVTHGHVYIGDQKVTAPGYTLTKKEEKQLEIRLPEPEETEEQEETEEASGESQTNEENNDDDEEAEE